MSRRNLERELRLAHERREEMLREFAESRARINDIFDGLDAEVAAIREELAALSEAVRKA